MVTAVSESQRRCPQCAQWKAWPSDFLGAHGRPIGRCAPCRTRYAKWGELHPRERIKRVRPRRAPSGDGYTVTFIPLTSNRKLGPMPTSLTDEASCPPACPLQGKGCYAGFGFIAMHWRNVATRGVTWRVFCEEIAALPHGTLWRHNEAGDLAGRGDMLDIEALGLLVAKNEGRRGFTFTAKPLRRDGERRAVAAANQLGFTINLSAHSLEHADELAALGIAPVSVVLPEDAPARGNRTPAGRRVVVCPADTSGLTCVQCRLCSVPTRKSIIGFRSHGQGAALVSELVRSRRKEAPRARA